MIKICLEYVWIDGNNNLRSKNRIIDFIKNQDLTLNDIPEWNFDGSSTNQAITKDSDIIIKPVRIYNNPFIKFMDSYLILCDCYTNNNIPHKTNTRINCVDIYEKYKDYECLFGIEQEYVIFNNDKKPYNWKDKNDPGIGLQGPYYCSIGGDRNFGREISLEHMKLCLEANVDICGTNSEVMASQWEFQIGICDALKISDDLWIARYILQRLSEKYNCYITFEPKPYNDNWNCSGGHTNFSTKYMRDKNGLSNILKACEKLKDKHKEHILLYGENNNLRLSGTHETSNINYFSYDIGNRETSIRIPINVHNNGYGYLEDRRPASNLDPYIVTSLLIKTICE